MRLSEMNAHQYIGFLDDAHRGVSLDDHLDVQFAGVAVGETEFLPLYRACMAESGTEVEGWKNLRRALRAYNLARYFEASRTVAGTVIELGVLKGFSALMLSRLWRAREADFRGAGLSLVDSFDGLSAPTPPDALGYKAAADGGHELVYAHQKGDMYGSLDHVLGVLGEFPEIAIHQGWIPEVLSTLPEATYRFVHIDVDLYDPTLASLDYFWPRLAPGGCIVNDDFASPLFPGGGEAWREFFEARKAPYVVLDSGQAVHLKA